MMYKICEWYTKYVNDLQNMWIDYKLNDIQNIGMTYKICEWPTKYVNDALKNIHINVICVTIDSVRLATNRDKNTAAKSYNIMSVIKSCKCYTNNWNNMRSKEAIYGFASPICIVNICVNWIIKVSIDCWHGILYIIFGRILRRKCHIWAWRWPALHLLSLHYK